MAKVYADQGNLLKAAEIYRYLLESEPGRPDLRDELSEIEKKLETYKSKIAQIGDVNLSAISEFEQHKERFDFLSTQEEDLEKAMDDLHQVIRKTNKVVYENLCCCFCGR